MPIKKQWLSIEEFEKIQGGGFTPAAHTHVKAEITDTPWAWGDVLKTGSNLTDLATRQHAGLTDVTENQHHNKLHSMTGVQHSAAGLTVGWVIKATGATTFAWGQLPHDKLAGLGDDDHTQYHNNTRGDARYYTRTKLQTSGQAEVHWGNITNEPTEYPPEFHYHVGKEIVSLHLVDLDYDPDIHPEDADIFDVLPTRAIHGEGNYDWWGTWDTTAPANTSAEVVVLAGDDKMLQLVDNNNASFVKTELATDAGHPIVTGVVQFQMRVTVGNKWAYFELDKDAVSNMYIYFGTAPQTIRFHGGVAEENLGAWVANTWYTFRIHFDCVARAAVVFLDNVFIARIALSAAAAGDYVSTLRARTSTGYDGYNVEINNLKVFNLTI